MLESMAAAESEVSTVIGGVCVSLVAFGAASSFILDNDAAAPSSLEGSCSTAADAVPATLALLLLVLLGPFPAAMDVAGVVCTEERAFSG